MILRYGFWSTINVNDQTVNDLSLYDAKCIKAVAQDDNVPFTNKLIKK